MNAGRRCDHRCRRREWVTPVNVGQRGRQRDRPRGNLRVYRKAACSLDRPERFDGAAREGLRSSLAEACRKYAVDVSGFLKVLRRDPQRLEGFVGLGKLEERHPKGFVSGALIRAAGS